MGFRNYLLQESAARNEARAISDRTTALLGRVTGKAIMNMGEVFVTVDGTKSKAMQFIIGKEWSIVVAYDESGAKYVFIYEGARITNISNPKYTIVTGGMNLFTFVRACKNLIGDLFNGGEITGALKSGSVDYYVDTKEDEIQTESVLKEAISFTIDGQYFSTKSAACQYLLSKGVTPNKIAARLDMQLPNISTIKKKMEQGGTDLKNVKVRSSADSPRVDASMSGEDEMTSKKIENTEVDITRLYKKMEMFIGSILDKRMSSLLISGDPGVGKSHTLEEMMKKRGMVPAKIVPTKPVAPESDDEDDEEEEEEEKAPTAKKRGRPKKEEDDVEDLPDSYEVQGDYVKYTGKITVAGLYRTICKFRHKLIILDDCDSIWSSRDGVNILKGALDSKTRREISYPIVGAIDVNPDDDAEISRVLADGKVPSQVVFDGQMVFITNLPTTEIDSAILSRVFYVNVRLSGNQVLNKIKQTMAASPKGISGSGTLRSQELAMSFFEDIFKKNPNWKPKIEKFNFRTFSKSAIFIDVYAKQFGEEGWEEMLMDDLEGRWG